MTSTVTATTLATVRTYANNGPSTTVSVIAILLLLVLLASREIVRALGGSRVTMRLRNLNIASIPLLVAFVCIMTMRFLFFLHTAASGAVPAPATAVPAPATIVIQNYPRTAVIGHTERLSVLLPGQPHTQLIFILHYPDGHEERTPMRSNGHGYSSHTFRVRSQQERRFRETATVGVLDAHGRVLALRRFAIQQR